MILVEDDYYARMFDIEGLTRLNMFNNRSLDEKVREVISLINANNCQDAQKNLNKSTLESESLEASMIRVGLSVKEILFKGALKNYKENSPKTCALKELSEYLNLPENKVEPFMLVEEPVAKSWREMNIDENNPDDILRFYKTTNSYIFELMAANHIIQTMYSFGEMIKRLEQYPVRKILDYGAGIGTLSILLSRKGYEVTYADLQSKTMDFAKWRFKKRKLDIPLIELAGDETNDLNKSDFKDKQYDCILTTEVVEHIPKPIEMLSLMHKKLPQNGLLIVSESCNYTDEFISHLKSNKKYGGARFKQIMKEIGFTEVPNIPFIPQQFYLKC